MTDHGIHDHAGSDGSTPDQRIRAEFPNPLKTGEILYWSGDLAVDGPMDWWLGSDRHRAIIEDTDFSHIGVSLGYSFNAREWVYVANFAKPTSRPLIAKHSEKALDVFEWSRENRGRIVQWSLHGGDNQQWRMEPVGEGYMRIVSQHSGKVLDVENGSTENGARIIQFEWWGGDNQRFLPERADMYHLRLRAKHSGKVLDVADISEADGAQIQQWEWWGGANQMFRP